jgi:hypothetical protein
MFMLKEEKYKGTVMFFCSGYATLARQVYNPISGEEALGAHDLERKQSALDDVPALGRSMTARLQQNNLRDGVNSVHLDGDVLDRVATEESVMRAHGIDGGGGGDGGPNVDCEWMYDLDNLHSEHLDRQKKGPHHGKGKGGKLKQAVQIVTKTLSWEKRNKKEPSS